MAENEVENEGGKKSSKLMIIIIAVVVLLAGGGAGFYFMSADESTEDDETTEVVEEEVSEEIVETTEVYYDFGKPLIVNFPKGSSARLIQVSLSLLVKDELIIEEIKKHEPMMRNNLLMAISAKGSENLMVAEGKQALREEMLKQMNDVMEKMTGKTQIENIFFTAFVMQ